MRVLHVTGTRPIGGIGTFLRQVAQFTSEQVQFSYIFSSSNPHGEFDNVVKQYGGQVYVLPNFKHTPIKYLRKLFLFYKKNASHFDVLHVHSPNTGAFDIIFARLFGLKTIILHAHTSRDSPYWFRAIRNNLLSHISLLFTKKNVACNHACGEYLFHSRPFYIVPNPINIDKFLPKPIFYRQSIRQDLKIPSNSIALLHVGYFDKVKNQRFLVDVICELEARKHSNKYEMFFIGDGELKSQIEDEVRIKDINNVHFLGRRSDVNRLMNAFDIFLLPSLFEGAPLTLLEAQANGLPCIVSDTITREVNISQTILFLDIMSSTSVKIWADAIEDHSIRVDFEPGGYIKKRMKAHDVKTVYNKLIDIYYESITDRRSHPHQIRSRN